LSARTSDTDAVRLAGGTLPGEGAAMSMVMYLRRASETDIAKIGEDAAAAERSAFEECEEASDLIDFDVAWDAVHFMLCGDTRDSNHPLGIIACNLPELGLDANGLGGFSVISSTGMKRSR
jgi:hypothetical protein